MTQHHALQLQPFDPELDAMEARTLAADDWNYVAHVLERMSRIKLACSRPDIRGANRCTAIAIELASQ